MEDEDDFLLGLYDDQPVVEEEVREDEDIFADLYKPVEDLSNDISYDDWNTAGEGLFDDAEEDLEKKLAIKYPDLTFDTPIMDGGYVNDELDVTNKDGEVFRWKMNTDYNANRKGLTEEEREKQSRSDYIGFLDFANKSKFNKEGEYVSSTDEKTLGPDYMVTNDRGEDVEMKVTPGLYSKAIQIMRADPNVTTLDEAIDVAA